MGYWESGKLDQLYHTYFVRWRGPLINHHPGGNALLIVLSTFAIDDHYLVMGAIRKGIIFVECDVTVKAQLFTGWWMNTAYHMPTVLDKSIPIENVQCLIHFLLC